MVEQTTQQKQCVHHWIIEFPNGRTSVGRCKYCGITKEFSNDMEVVYVEKERNASQQPVHTS